MIDLLQLWFWWSFVAAMVWANYLRPGPTVWVYHVVFVLVLALAIIGTIMLWTERYRG